MYYDSCDTVAASSSSSSYFLSHSFSKFPAISHNLGQFLYTFDDQSHANPSQLHLHVLCPFLAPSAQDFSCLSPQCFLFLMPFLGFHVDITTNRVRLLTRSSRTAVLSLFIALPLSRSFLVCCCFLVLY